jgi:hypothetical protein
MRTNGREGLLTCCIRPSSIFGPGDKLLVPSLVAAARAGKSKVRISTLHCATIRIHDFYHILMISC